jgi:hypothetical protein
MSAGLEQGMQTPLHLQLVPFMELRLILLALQLLRRAMEARIFMRIHGQVLGLEPSILIQQPYPEYEALALHSVLPVLQ